MRKGSTLQYIDLCLGNSTEDFSQFWKWYFWLLYRICWSFLMSGEVALIHGVQTWEKSHPSPGPLLMFLLFIILGKQKLNKLSSTKAVSVVSNVLKFVMCCMCVCVCVMCVYLFVCMYVCTCVFCLFVKYSHLAWGSKPVMLKKSFI